VNSISAEESRASTSPPAFDGFPYLATRIVSGLNHIILLPALEDCDLFHLHDTPRLDETGFPPALSSIGIHGRSSSLTGRNRLRPTFQDRHRSSMGSFRRELFPETRELRSRRGMLQKFPESLKSCAGDGDLFMTGDLTKGGWIPRPDDGHRKGFQRNGVPRRAQAVREMPEVER